MINKIEYIFNLTLNTSLGYDVPGIDIKTFPDNLPEDVILEIEIMQLSGEYVKEIVEELEEIKNGDMDYCSFGFETTMINVAKIGYMNPVTKEKYLNGRVSISYNYGQDHIVTNLKIEDILKMMTDWRDYIDAWEKKTGKVYNGI